MMGSRTRSVGVDIGATAVRVVEVSGLDADSVAQVTRVAIEPLPHGAVVAGSIQDPAAVGWALEKAFKASGASTYGAVLGIAGSDTAVARLQAASALKATEWEQWLRTSGRPISPKLPLDKSAVSMYPVPDPTDLVSPVNRTLLAAATTDEEVETLARIAKKVKVTPRAIDLSAAAVVRALTRVVPGNDDVVTVVDLGCSKVTVATRAGLHLRSVRTFEGGGDRITRALMGALGGTFAEAEEAKLTMRLPTSVSSPQQVHQQDMSATYGALPQMPSVVPAAADAANDALMTAAAALVEEIAGAVESDTAANPQRPTLGVQLCGGTSLLRGLKEQVVQRIGVPAVIGRPWARIIPSKNTESALSAGVEDPVVMLSLATAIGLAIWKDAR